MNPWISPTKVLSFLALLSSPALSAAWLDASRAISDGRIFLRSNRLLCCIGADA